MDTCIPADGINAFYPYSTPSFTWKSGLKCTGLELNYMTDGSLRNLLENIMRGVPAFVMGKSLYKTN